MADPTLLLSQFYIKFEGAEAPEPMMLNLVDATVENSLHLPDVATLTFHDPMASGSMTPAWRQARR